jgi:hypothetical protein
MGSKNKCIRKAKKKRFMRTNVPVAIGLKGFEPCSLAALIPEQAKPGAVLDESGIDHVLAAVATNTWRAIQKMLDLETKEPKPEMTRIFRHIEAIQEALAEIGIETIDHTGQRFDTGSALKVVTSEKRAGLVREEIIETLKPTVRRQGRLLQQGEVIVGEPQ